MRGTSIVALTSLIVGCASSVSGSHGSARDAATMDLASPPDASADVSEDDDVSADLGPAPTPFASNTPESRLYLTEGATMVVTRNKIRYGWGDNLGRTLGVEHAPPVTQPRRLDLELDEATWQYSFNDYGFIRRRRDGRGSPQWQGGLIVGVLPWVSSPTEIDIPPMDLVQAGRSASRRDGVWCWSVSGSGVFSIDRCYDGRFCTYIPGARMDSSARSLCGYDCERRQVVCNGIWLSSDGAGGQLQTESPNFDWTLPAEDVTAIGTTFGAVTVVRHDGTLWCRGYCGGDMVGTNAPRHDDFRQIRGLPPVVFAQGSIGAYTNPPDQFICALLRDGTVTCWGGCTPLLGYPCEERTGRMYVYENIGGLHEVVEIAMSSAHVCALTANDEVWCWGANLHAVDPTSDDVLVWQPRRVFLPGQH